MADQAELEYIVPFGPDANCTVEICPMSYTVYHYLPSLGANTTFIVLFSISMLIHIIQGIRYRTWFYAIAAAFGCACEMIGYGGRIMLWQNPFSFTGFMVQICCITFAPVFYNAAIYVTLTGLVRRLDPALSWFSPKLYYWVFIPCDIISLILQGVGGGSSTSTSGTSGTAVDITLAGLSFQVFTLLVFIALGMDYVLRYLRHQRALLVADRKPIHPRMRIFGVFFSLAMLLILIRCIYRIDELSHGYGGDLIHDEGTFIGLEGVMIVVASFCLSIGHPGYAFRAQATLDQERAQLPKGEIESS